MRTFAPLVDGDLPVPGELLDALVDALGAPGRWVLIGATARDLALILEGVSLPSKNESQDLNRSSWLKTASTSFDRFRAHRRNGPSAKSTAPPMARDTSTSPAIGMSQHHG